MILKLTINNMWYLPKDYVWVHTRVTKAHEKHGDKLSIKTNFDIKENIVIFTAEVIIWEQTFNWSSFWEIWKEKAFEKLETVAIGRALAFAWFEIKEWIASSDEMERFNDKPRWLIDCINDMKSAETKEDRVKFKEEWKTFAKTDKQIKWLTDEWNKLW